MLNSFAIKCGQLIANDLGRSDVWLAFACQVQLEVGTNGSGISNNNPLNLTGTNMLWANYGQTGYYGGGTPQEHHSNFATFDTLEHGCNACAANYRGSYYHNVIASLSTGDPVQVAQAIQDSPWDSGHYGGHNLVDLVKSSLGQPTGGDNVAVNQNMLEKLYNGFFHRHPDPNAQGYIGQPDEAVINSLWSSQEHAIVEAQWAKGGQYDSLEAKYNDTETQLANANSQVKTLTDNLNTEKVNHQKDVNDLNSKLTEALKPNPNITNPIYQFLKRIGIFK